MTNLVADDVIKPVIDRYYSLEQAADAVGYIREGHACGKVVIKVI